MTIDLCASLHQVLNLFILFMIDKLKCTEIGVLIKSHGIAGEVAILLKDGIYSDMVEANFLFLDLDDGLVPFKVKHIRDKNDNVILVKFVLLSDEKNVKPLIGSAVWITTTDLVESETNSNEGVYIGYRIIDNIHGDIGTIEEIRDPERNPLFVINGDKGEILIPIAEEFIVEIKDDVKEIRTSTPEGLLDLYL